MTRLTLTAFGTAAATAAAFVIVTLVLQAEVSFERRIRGEWQERALMAEHELALSRRIGQMQDDRIEQLQDEVARRVLPPGDTRFGVLPKAKKQ